MGPIGWLLVHIFSNLNPKRSSASHPGRIPISRRKLKALAPSFYPSANFGSWVSWLFGMMLMRRAALKMHLRYGDSRAAVVVSVAPLVVAAYSDEFDGVVLLQFPPELVQRFKLKVGSTLLTVNTYDAEGELRPDIARASSERRTIHRNF